MEMNQVSCSKSLSEIDLVMERLGINRDRLDDLVSRLENRLENILKEGNAPSNASAVPSKSEATSNLGQALEQTNLSLSATADYLERLLQRLAL